MHPSAISSQTNWQNNWLIFPLLDYHQKIASSFTPLPLDGKLFELAARVTRLFIAPLAYPILSVLALAGWALDRIVSKKKASLLPINPLNNSASTSSNSSTLPQDDLNPTESHSPSLQHPLAQLSATPKPTSPASSNAASTASHSSHPSFTTPQDDKNSPSNHSPSPQATLAPLPSTPKSPKPTSVLGTSPKTPVGGVSPASSLPSLGDIPLTPTLTGSPKTPKSPSSTRFAESPPKAGSWSIPLKAMKPITISTPTSATMVKNDSTPVKPQTPSRVKNSDQPLRGKDQFVHMVNRIKEDMSLALSKSATSIQSLKVFFDIIIVTKDGTEYRIPASKLFCSDSDPFTTESIIDQIRTLVDKISKNPAESLENKELEIIDIQWSLLWKYKKLFAAITGCFCSKHPHSTKMKVRKADRIDVDPLNPEESFATALEGTLFENNQQLDANGDFIKPDEDE